MCDISSSFRVGSTTRHFIISLVQQNTVTCFSLRGQQKHFASVLGEQQNTCFGFVQALLATEYGFGQATWNTCFGLSGRTTIRGKKKRREKPKEKPRFIAR